MKVIFWGSSDDLVEIEGIEMTNGDDAGHIGAEVGCYATRNRVVNGIFQIGDELQVYAIYDGCWVFGIGRVERERGDEYRTLPDWPIKVTNCEHNDYSTQLEIDVPENFKCTIVYPKPGDE